MKSSEVTPYRTCIHYVTYLWDNLKVKVYRLNPYTEEELKENIRREILNVPQEELRLV
jgi:hypothetical protein